MVEAWIERRKKVNDLVLDVKSDTNAGTVKAKLEKFFTDVDITSLSEKQILSLYSVVSSKSVKVSLDVISSAIRFELDRRHKVLSFYMGQITKWLAMIVSLIAITTRFFF